MKRKRYEFSAKMAVLPHTPMKWFTDGYSRGDSEGGRKIILELSFLFDEDALRELEELRRLVEMPK